MATVRHECVCLSLRARVFFYPADMFQDQEYVSKNVENAKGGGLKSLILEMSLNEALEHGEQCHR